MKALLLALTISLFAFSSFAKTTKKTDPVKDFKSGFQSPAFSDVKISKSDELELSATDTYKSAAPTQQKTYVTEAVKSWQEKSVAADAPKKDQLATVVWTGGGELWAAQADTLKKVDEWSDNKLYYPETASPNGRLFAFFGGQVVQGGAADVTGFNARVGSTLYQNRYDLAATFTYASINTTPSVTTNSIGVVGRALFPLTDHVGYNLGGQLVRTDVGGTSENTPGAVAGLNFFAPEGSFDVTLSAVDAGRWSLLAGYTIFFDKQ